MFQVNEIVNVLGFGRCAVISTDGVLVEIRTASGEVFVVAHGECRRAR